MIRCKKINSKSILISVLLIMGILKFAFFTNVITGDSYEYLLMAKAFWYSHSPLINIEINKYRSVFHEPVYSLLIVFFYPLFRDFELSAHFVTVAASILSIFLIYLLMEKIQTGSGKFAAIIVATSSLHLIHSSLILRDMVSFCLICVILYFFYVRDSFPLYKIILLGFLIACASLLQLFNSSLLIPFLYLGLKKRKIYSIPILLGLYAIVIGPYIYLRLFNQNWNSMDASIERYFWGGYKIKTSIIPIIFHYLKEAFSKFLHFDPLILIFGLAGIIIILRGNIARQKLLNKFWGLYFLSYLSILIFWSSKVKIFGDSYLLPLFFPLILTSSVYLDSIFKDTSSSARQLRLKWMGLSLVMLYMILLHWKMLEFFSKKMGISNPVWLKWGFLSLILLFSLGMFSIKPFYKKISSRHIMVLILITLSIQVLDEVIQIKGRYTMATRGKELSPEINALKGNILPENAFLIGVEDGMGILYHTGYPLFYEDFDRIASKHVLGEKWTNKNVKRIINLSKVKPVICVYDHLYRYYLKGMGVELYETVQEKYRENLVFSNLDLNIKIYLLDNTSKMHDYKSAINYFTAQLQKRPYNLNLLNYLAWACFCSGDFDRSIELWQKRIDFVKGNADSYNNIGLTYARKGEYQRAIACYEKALGFQAHQDPYRIRWAKAMIYLNLAQAYEKANEKEKAIRNWKKYYDSIPYSENRIIMERHINNL